jgi:hypothetical protein
MQKVIQDFLFVGLFSGMGFILRNWPMKGGVT